MVLTFVFLFVECQTIGAGDVDAKPRLTTDSGEFSDILFDDYDVRSSYSNPATSH